MTIQRRYAPISGRFETESLAGLTGISNYSDVLCAGEFPIANESLIRISLAATLNLRVGDSRLLLASVNICSGFIIAVCFVMENSLLRSESIRVDQNPTVAVLFQPPVGEVL
jgi:hypothetical protein